MVYVVSALEKDVKNWLRHETVKMVAVRNVEKQCWEGRAKIAVRIIF
jgi:hypothetical protein